MKVTPRGSNTKMVVFIMVAVLTAAMSGLQAIDFSEPKQVSAFVISLLLSGMSNWGAFLDRSKADLAALEEKTLDKEEKVE